MLTETMLRAAGSTTGDSVDRAGNPLLVHANERLSPARIRHLVDVYFAFVSRTLRGLGVREPDIEDAAQLVFLVASDRLTEIEGARERGFLFQTALRIASRARRTYTRRREASDEAVGERGDPRPGPDELTEQRLALRRLDDVLDTMPSDLRSVFVLHELEELTMAEIAAAVGAPIGTVASRLRRAREMFDTAAHEMNVGQEWTQRRSPGKAWTRREERIAPRCARPRWTATPSGARAQ